MAQSIHEFHDDPRNADIRIWVNGALKHRNEAVVSVFEMTSELVRLSHPPTDVASPV